MTIIRKFEQDPTPGKFSKKYILLLSVSLLILVLAEIWVNNTLLIYGDKFDNLSATRHYLNMENQILENQIARENSLENLSSKSAELGFLKSEDVEYIR